LQIRLTTHPNGVLVARSRGLVAYGVGMDDDPSLPAGLIVLLIGSTLVSFGYLKAVMDRANADYKETKAKLPLLRKAFWAACWRAVKIGVLVFIAGLIMVAWVVHDVRDSETPQPTPAQVTK
jgi:hypothetical protein